MRRPRLAPSLVVTFALAPACTRASKTNDTTPKSDDTGTTAAANDPPERSYTEFRDGICRVIPDCSPMPGSNVNPCNPPPPQVIVDCPAELLPTQPPGTTVKTQADGTCWVDCDDAHCDKPGALRVRCPKAGEPAPDYATNVIVPQATSARYDTGVFHRRADLRCDLVECEDGTQCAKPPGRTITNVPCPPELAPATAKGVVPVMSTKDYACHYGTTVVACPKRFHVWH